VGAGCTMLFGDHRDLRWVRPQDRCGSSRYPEASAQAVGVLPCHRV